MKELKLQEVKVMEEEVKIMIILFLLIVYNFCFSFIVLRYKNYVKIFLILFY